jgi:catechol 1,2-dioxygenase
MSRTETVVRELLDAIRAVLVAEDVSYDEYRAAKQWLIEVGEAGEWPLFLDVFVGRTVERNAFRERAGSPGTILGPYHLPELPILPPPGEMPRRPDERGEPLTLSGRVTGAGGVRSRARCSTSGTPTPTASTRRAFTPICRAGPRPQSCHARGAQPPL